ncbi:hypothetical protein F2Q70_00004362 [Brassica cretica]|uniref:Uncharacterized protein n=1 Tax=Brassica cretica TaxID=69181 RepID=A0A8S9J0A1_BRACR|nr:hypothetical protein F2Q70_00004362 [Brassica cretica]
MDEEETVAQFSAKLCDISNDFFALGKLVKKLKRSLSLKFESNNSALEEAHNLAKMAFDEFVGILQAFELSKSYGEKNKDKKKEDPYGVALKGSYSEVPMAMITRQFANFLKQTAKQQEKKRNNKSDSDTDSCNDKNLRNLVVFTTLDSSYEKKTAAGSASASVPVSSCGDLAKNYETLYAHWLTMVEESSVLAKEKVKLEAQIGEALKYALGKEEEAREARV